MNKNETRTLWISVGAALFAVFLLYSYTEQKSREVMEKYGKKSRVVVAAKDIDDMQTIDETMLEMVERPDSFKEPSVVTDPELAVGQVALAPIRKGEQILENKIIQPGTMTGLALQVAPSKRAVTIPIDEMRGVAKLLNPGDRVDLITALDVGKPPNQRREVKTLMQDVVILATGVRVTNEMPRFFEKAGMVRLRGDTTFSTITIEASPEDSQKLIYILSTSPGALFITLRHPSDHTRKRYPNVTVESLVEEVPQAVIQQQFMRQPTAVTPPTPAPAPKKQGPFQNL
ncbi:MAG: Flp pilus assembly protein CpaB [Bdellovibrionales bacterium]|nr:Flp pilus assembly protein CpaB [Bdellovibrionales bacterium]